jgi:hypothetical protein
MSKAPETARAVARVALAAFGGTPKVRQYLNETEDRGVDILECVDRPEPGFTCYSTLDLHLAENLLEGQDIRVEFAAVAQSSAAAMAKVLGTSALNVRDDGWLAAPGVVFPGLLTQYELSSTLEHVMWMEPFAYQELSEVDLGDGVSVHWLMAMPISESERRFVVAEGYDALEQRFAEAQVEYWNLAREPLV